MRRTPDAIGAAKRELLALLSNEAGVTGVGVGAGEDGSPALVVLLKTEDPALRARIPSRVVNFPVIVGVSGTPRAF